MKNVLKRTEWFRKAEYGFFFHFLNSGSTLHPPENRSQRVPAPPDEWNRMVDRFDVHAIAKQLSELRAGYAFLTVGQNSGYYCAPNATYDRIMGLSGDHSKCSRRDLVSDFSDALAEYGIPLLVYTTALAPGFDFDALRNLKSVPPWNCNANCGNYQEIKRFAGTEPRLREFQTLWNAIHSEWMRRWGTKVRGWWVDGAYFADRMYAFPDEPNGRSFAQALRTGNPDAILAMNPGMVYPPRAVDPNQDYLAGEVNDPEYGLLHGPMIDGMQYHVLSYVGQNWGRGPARADGRTLAAMTRNITDNGGVVSWDIPFSPEGIDADLFATLKEFAELYARSKRVFPKTSVDLLPPFWNGEGKGVPGRVKLHSELDGEVEMELEWNGVRHSCKYRKEWQMELPAVRSKECRLRLKCGGFSREIPVCVGREFRFGRTPSAPIVLNAEEGGRVLGSYRCSIEQERFLVDAEIFEKEYDVRERPWEGSCLEIFLADGEKRKLQFCIRHDGKVFQVADGVVSDCSSVLLIPGERKSDSFRIRVEIPLLLLGERWTEKREFLFNFQQTVKQGEMFLRNSLSGFSVCGVSAFAKAVFRA